MLSVRARCHVACGLTTASEMAGALASTSDAVGHSVLNLLCSEQPPRARGLALGRVQPSRRPVPDGTSPWHVPLGLIHHRNAAPEVWGVLEEHDVASFDE